jgi:hypothetical protein
MEVINQILFIEATIGDDVLAEIVHNVDECYYLTNLKIYKSSTKRLHNTRRRILADDNIFPESYMVWNKQSLRDGKILVCNYRDIYSIRLPLKTAVYADYRSQAMYVRLENFS